MRWIDAANPATLDAAIEEAAAVLRQGGLVAFPTETVYGLGANALDPDAVQRIYAAKGRPSWNPLIVHVATPEAARELAAIWTPIAAKLAGVLWPGPLTLVLDRASHVPATVSAGLPSIAVRVPDQPIARRLLEAAGVPVAAPSANRSTELSPTRAEHVARSLADRVDIILDGGPTRVGIESTVVDVTGEVAFILRPGTITRSQIERLVPTAPPSTATDLHQRSPGQMERHYSPRTPVILFDRDLPSDASPDVAAITHSGRDASAARAAIDLGSDPLAYAAALYETMHRLDQQGFVAILIERPPETPEWEGVRDRLERAAGKT